MFFRLVAFATCLLLASCTFAADFRIETKVYMGDDDRPKSENTTLFHNGVIYDFAEGPSRIAIFRHGADGQPGRFVLLLPQLSLRTEINAQRVDAALDKLGQWAMRQRDPLLRFAANPSFEEKFDEATGKLQLTGSMMTYELATSPLNQPEAMGDLENYLNWYAKLNCLLSPSIPPHARLEVNQALIKRGRLATEVTLTLGGDRSTRLRAEHVHIWRLSKEDRDRIRLVGDQLSLFTEVTNEEFQQAEHQAAKVTSKAR